MARALKVYCTPSGFSDALVAAPNQTAGRCQTMCTDL